MIFQTSRAIDRIWREIVPMIKEEAFEECLAELKKAHELRILDRFTPALDKINEAWKVALKKCTSQADAQQGVTSMVERITGIS